MDHIPVARQLSNSVLSLQTQFETLEILHVIAFDQAEERRHQI